VTPAGGSAMEPSSTKTSGRLKAVSIRIMELIQIMRLVAVVTVEKERRPIDENRRIEAPSKWAVEDSIRWNKRPDSKPWVPIPTRAVPAGAIPGGTWANIEARLIDSSPP
jgi:hypothetical protein